MLNKNFVFQGHHNILFLSKTIFKVSVSWLNCLPNAAWISADLKLCFLVSSICSWNMQYSFSVHRFLWAESILQSFSFFMFTADKEATWYSFNCQKHHVTTSVYLKQLDHVTSSFNLTPVGVWLQYWLWSAYLCW